MTRKGQRSAILLIRCDTGIDGSPFHQHLFDFRHRWIEIRSDALRESEGL
jgi:hypothetical protein